jgi:U3 small nucleolar RNA-associated protein 22
VHPTDDYDFVIQLDRAVLPRHFQNVILDEATLATKGKKYANLLRMNGDDVATSLRPGFDPARLLFEDLRVRNIFRDSSTLHPDTYTKEDLPWHAQILL